MLFKDISYLELWWPFCSAERNNLCLCNFGRGYPEEQFYKNYFEFGPVVQEEITFERFFYLELWQPSCSVEQNHLCNFCKEQCEEQFCEFILYLDLWFRGRCRFNQFLSRALAVPLFRGGEPFVQFW